MWRAMDGRGQRWFLIAMVVVACLSAACGGGAPPPVTPLPRPTTPPPPTAPRPPLDTPVAQATGPAGATGPGAQVRHQVRPGETLGQIAQQYYGNANRWQPIFEANRAVIVDPNALPLGATLTIPPP